MKEIGEYNIAGANYHLYLDNYASATILTREWGPILGVKLSKAIWHDTSYCCTLHINSGTDSGFFIVDKKSGTKVVSIP